jgi:hypothetical protein
MIALAKGEHDQVRGYFIKFAEKALTLRSREYHEAYQSDLVFGLLASFPSIYEYQVGKPLLRKEEVQMMYDKMLKRLGFFARHERAFVLLARAKASEVLARGNTNFHYDKALRKARDEDNMVVQILGNCWFGIHLMGSGDDSRKEFLRRAHRLAIQVQFEGLQLFIERVAERNKVRIDISRKPEESKVHSPASLPFSELVSEHLSFMARLGPKHYVVQNSLNILAKYYNSGTIHCFIQNSDGQYEIATSATKDAAQVLASVSLYFNLRSTLPMHISHAAWLTNSSASVQSTESQQSTQVLSSDMSRTVTSETFASSFGSDKATGLNNERIEQQMFGLVPIRSESDTVGLIVIENLGDTAGRDLNACRSELDAFGIQVGMLLRNRDSQYQYGSARMEPCLWLESWLEGKMRKDREASWYLGLNLSDSHYLLVYCCLKGDAEIRDTCSKALWLQMHVLRSIAQAAGQTNFDLATWRQEVLNVLQIEGSIEKLDDLLLAVSIVDRDHGFVYSGHFGNARPCVLGVENKISAFNQSAGRLRDGRDLRYWEAIASFSFNNVYVLSYDTSRIQSTVQLGTERAQVKMEQSLDERSVLQLLDGAKLRGELPRYYLGVLRRENAGQTELEDLAPTRDAS